MTLRSAIALSAFCWICVPAQAGNPKIEADRCLRWLDAFFHGQIDQATLITTEQLRPDDVPEVYLTAQYEKLIRLHDLIYRIGSGAPKSVTLLEDKIVARTGDIIKRQKWTFSPNLQAYVGCVSYAGTDNPWNLVAKFEDNLDVLTRGLENAASSRLASQPDGN